MACPGSVDFTRGMPDHSSRAAEEGTAAHKLLEHCLLKNRAPVTFLGQTILGFEVTHEMSEAVEVAVDYVRDLRSGAHGKVAHFSPEMLVPIPSLDLPGSAGLARALGA